MSITNITATNVNGIQDISTSQTIANGVNATAIDEALLFRNSVVTNNSTGTIVLTNCAVKVGDLDYWISYGTNLQTASTITFDDCYVEWNIANVRRNIRISKLLGTHLRSTNSGSNGLAFMYTQAGNKAVIDAKDGKPTVIDGLYVHEIAGALLTYQNAIYKNCGINILNWEAGNLTIRNVTYGSGTKTGTSYTGPDGGTYNTYDAWLGNGNSANRFRFIDCVINLSKIAINLSGVVNDERIFKSFSRSEKYLNGTSPVNGLNIKFTPTANTGVSSQIAFFVTTNAQGLTSTAKVELLVQNTLDSGNTRSSGLADPATIRNYTLKNITWNRKIRGYSYLPEDADATPTSQVGDIGKESNVYLLSDIFVTLTEANANALTGIAIDKTTKTITLTSNVTLDQVYDFSKAFFVKQANFDWIAFFSGSGTTLDILDWNIIGMEFLTNGTKFKLLKSTGVLTANASFNNITINGNVTQATPTNLSNVTISGTLSYNTNASSNFTFTNVVISGSVSNTGTGAIVLKKVSSSFTNGTNVTSYVPTYLNLTLNGGRILILDNSNVEQYNQTTDGLIELSSTASGIWSYRIAKFGQKLIENTFTIDGTTKQINASFITDTFVSDTEVNVTAYTELNSLQQIYDYQSYNLTTTTGIRIGNKLTKGFGTLSVEGGITTDSAQVDLFSYASNILTTKTSSLLENVTLMATGNFIQNTTTLSNDLKVRALNLDSEIIFSTDSVTFYPTLTDRDAGTNAGVTATGGIYRYKFGNTYSGVVMTNPLHIRYVIGTLTSLDILAITQFNFRFDISTNQLIIQTNDNLRKVNRNVIKASKLIPANETF